ncbi:MAG: hypothetical protein ACK4V6_10445 [Microthrixaceae bacterium]
MSWSSHDYEPPAGAVRRSGGSGWSSPERLGEAIADEERLLVGVEARVEEERAKLARFKELFEHRHELYEEQAWLRRERFQVEQKVLALERRAERERRRLERRAVSADGSRRGRPVRVDVDDEAWAALKREAVRRRLWLGWWVGELVRVEVEALESGRVSGRPSTRRRRSPGEDEPQPRLRFLRIDVDDDHWSAFRAAALDVELTVGRFIGELAEAAAHESGWRNSGSR